MKQKLSVLIIIAFLCLLVGCQEKQIQIRFVDWDNAIISEVELSQGETIVAPEVPIREGYVFTGWSENFTIATQDLTVVAQYDVRVWTVTFQGINQEILKNESVTHNMSAIAPEVIAPLGYHFTGWDMFEFQIDTSEIVLSISNDKVIVEDDYVLNISNSDYTTKKSANVTHIVYLDDVLSYEKKEGI